eukprot:6136281-Prymnesium_polylepis.2
MARRAAAAGAATCAHRRPSDSASRWRAAGRRCPARCRRGRRAARQPSSRGSHSATTTGCGARAGPPTGRPKTRRRRARAEGAGGRPACAGSAH